MRRSGRRSWPLASGAALTAVAAAAAAAGTLGGPITPAAHRGAPHGGKPPAPRARTGRTHSVTATAARLEGVVGVSKRRFHYWFEYGRTRRYGARSPAHGVGASRRDRRVNVGLRRLRPATTYHYRLMTSCHGCQTRAGRDRSFRTPPPRPAARTRAAVVLGETAATLRGTVNPHGATTTYYFQYGTSSSYGGVTAGRRAGRRRSARNVSLPMAGLQAATTYHYRLVATHCGGCATGTAAGRDTVFTTRGSLQRIAAVRAVSTYQAMQAYFTAASAYPGDTTGLYTETYPQSGKRYSYLWPFSRALVGTLTLAGIPAPYTAGYWPDFDARLAALTHYWNASATPPGYDSYPVAPAGNGGDRYYDDQAWIGLALLQDYRRRGNAASLTSARNVFDFVYPGGQSPQGGIYWVQQSSGMGQTNHDRTTTSNAPNAELGYGLEQVDAARAPTYRAAADSIESWVVRTLYNVPGSTTYDSSQPPIMFDKLTGGGVDETRWTYNQGAVVAAEVAAYRNSGQRGYLARAEALARAALKTFAEADYVVTQPPAFNAIYFRGLLQLAAVTSDGALRQQIVQTLKTYSDDVWNDFRDSRGLFHFPFSGPTDRLLDQGAMVQVFAMLAWNQGDWPLLP